MPVDWVDALRIEISKEKLRKRHRSEARSAAGELRSFQKHDRRTMRLAEFFTRRGQITIWFYDELCAGLTDDQKQKVDEFLLLEAPFLMKALVYDYDAREIRIRRRGEESLSSEPLSKFRRDFYERAHQKAKADTQTAYQKAVDQGEIGKVERFVEELKNEPTISE